MASKSQPKDWEDEYRRLQAKHEQLKIDYNEKEQHNKLLLARIRKLENDVAQLERQLGLPRSSQVKGDKEEGEMISSLSEQVSKLKTQNTLQHQKLNQLTDELEKKKKENISLKKTMALRKAGSSHAKPETPMELELVPGKVKTIGSEPLKQTGTADHSQLLDVARNQKARIAALERENADLRKRLENSAIPPPPSTNKHHSSETESQLRETTWKLQQLQAQYDYLVSKSSAQNETSRSAESQLEDYRAKIKELKSLLEDLRDEKEKSDRKAAKVENLEELVAELRNANRSLEEKITRLCEAPFISDAFGQHEARLRYEELVKERENLLIQVEHLQEAVRTHYSALNSLKQQAATLREEKEESDRKAEEFRLRLQELEQGNTLAQEQLKLFSGEDGVDVETLEKALTMVKRRDIALEKLPFLEQVDSDGLITIPAMKRKLEEYQLLNLRLTEDNERLENMLKLQSNINKDLHKELESLVYARDKDKSEMKKKASEFEQLALSRLDKIHSLEAQLRQFVYGVTKNGKHMKGRLPEVAGNEIREIDSDDGNEDLIAELLRDQEDVKPDENLLEIWVKNASIKDGVLTPGSSTFIVVDFFDYESQTTTVLSGTKPAWDFAATYKINVDDFLLRFFATDVVTFELNMASQGDFTFLGRCSIPLSPLLKSKPRIRIENYPVVSARTGQIIAQISVDMRLALPISELYRLFLERHPDEKKSIEELATKRLQETTVKNSAVANNYTNMVIDEDQDRLYNELDVVIHRADGLRMEQSSSDHKDILPSTYVHFQLLGHPDKFTKPSFKTVNPIYNEKFTFPVVTTDSQLRLLSRSRVLFSLIDFEKDGSMLGEAEVSLAPLHEGLTISDRFALKNNQGERCGEIYLTIKWRHQLRKQRELGPTALSGIDIETIISAFSPGNLKEGLVDYESFCKYISPSKHVQEGIDNLRTFFIALLEKEGKTIKELLFEIYGSTVVDADTFVKQLLKYKPDMPPGDLQRIFEFINNSEEKKLTLEQIASSLNIDEISGISFVLQNKLRARNSELVSRGIQPLKLFQGADQWGSNGVITRGEFKSVLRKMGFSLVDEPEVIQTTVPAKQDRYELEAGNQLLDDSNDNILEHGNELLMESGEMVRKDGLNEFMKHQRDIFEQKKSEIQERSKEALKEYQQGLSEKPQQDHSIVEHRASVERKPTVTKETGKSIEEDYKNKLATKLQSHYRGYSARKQLSNSPPENNGGTQPPNRVTTLAEEPLSLPDILEVEHILSENLKSGTKPNLIDGFLKVDQRKTGYVSRQQFAHVLKQYPAVQLHGKELRSCMDYFDVQHDGKLIDYNAFLRFYKMDDIPQLVIIQKLKAIILSKNSMKKFRDADVNGTGFLTRSETMKVFTQFGMGSWSHSILIAILKMFETKKDGLVNYLNLCEFISDTDGSRELEKISSEFYGFINENRPPDDHQLRKWFERLDSKSEGRFTSNQFLSFCASNNLVAKREVLFALYSEWDPNGSGVLFSSFFSWMKTYYTTQIVSKIDDMGFVSLTVDELRKKCSSFLALVAENGFVEHINSMFEVYNWRRNELGLVPRAVFSHVLRKSGFPLTIGEIRMLATQFSNVTDPSIVSYKHFLTWCHQPVPRHTDSLQSDNIVHSPRQLIAFLEKHLNRGTDLLSVFSRYDNSNTGKISLADFCSAMADLGISSISILEAKQLGTQFGALYDEFISYKRIVSELLRGNEEPVNVSEINPVDKLIACLQNSNIDIAKFRSKIEYYDQRDSGQIHKDDLREIFYSLHIDLNHREFNELVLNHLSNNDWILYNSLLRSIERRLSRGEVDIVHHDLPPDLVDKLKAAVETLILKGVNYQDEFDSYDPGFTGSVVFSDFQFRNLFR